MWLLTGVHFLFCKSSRLRTPSSLGQPGGSKDHSSGEGFSVKGDLQVRVAHKILGYDLIQKSFAALKYVTKAKDPRLQRITIVEHSFLLPEGSSTQGGVTLAGSSSSQQVAKIEEGGEEGEEPVIELGQSEDEFVLFDQFDLSEDPSGDLGDLSLTEADLQGTPS